LDFDQSNIPMNFPDLSYTHTLLPEHEERQKVLQDKRALRLLMNGMQPGMKYETIFSISSDNFLSSIPDHASCRPDEYPHWNQTLFESLPWEYVSSQKNVDTYVKHIPATKLLAFRGVSLIENIHISQAVGPFVNVTHSLDWIPVLQHIEAVPIIDKGSKQPIEHLQGYSASAENAYHWYHSDAIYQVLRLPWPISPRDLYLYRHFTFDATRRQVTVRYHSLVESDRGRLELWRALRGSSRASSTEMIRAVTPHTVWRFTAIPAASTTPPRPTEPTESKESKESAPATQNCHEPPLPDEGNTTPVAAVIVASPSRWKSALRRLTSKLARTWTENVVPWWQRRQTQWTRFLSMLSERRPTVPSMGASSRRDEAKMPSVESTDDNLSSTTTTTATTTTTTTTTTCLPTPTRPRSRPNVRPTTCPSRATTTHVLVEIETVVDSRGLIPTWFINFMQRQWPVATLSTFRQLAAAGDIEPHPAVSCW
jgi:hypothetical protein